MARLICSIILIHLFLWHVLAVPVHAAEYGMTASTNFRATYDDNVFFENIEDLEYRFTPTLTAAAVSEKAQVQASASLDVRIYQDNSDFNTTDQYYQLLAGVAASDRLQLDVIGTYVDDKTVAASLAETGILADRDTRRSATLAPVATFWLAPRDRLQLSYGLNSTNFSDPGTRDYLDNDLRLAWSHDLKNERTSLSFTVGGAQTDYDDIDGRPGEKLRQRSVGGLVGFDHRLTETVSFSLLVGPRYTDSNFRGSNREDKESTGVIGSTELDWRSERTAVFLRANLGYVPSTLGENVNRVRVDLGWRYAFTESLNCGLYGGYRYSETDEAETESRNQTFVVWPQMNYRLLQNLDLLVEYRHTWTEDKVANETDERNLVFVELRWLIHRPEWRIRQPRPLVEWPYR